MGVRIDEAGQYSVAREIDFLSPACRQREHLFVRAHCQKSSARDRHCLGPRLARIHRPDIGVIENEIWFGALQPEKRQRAQ